MSILVTQFRSARVAASLIALVLSGCAGTLKSDEKRAKSEETPHTSVKGAKLLFDEKEIHGRYYFGDGLAVNCSLSLDPNHRFTFKWRGCLGEYDSNFGPWKLDGDIVILSPGRPNIREGFRGMSVRLVPVKWGKRHYLIDEHEMPGFCAAAAQGKFPRRDDIHGRDYVKCDGGKLPAIQGTPLIPKRYQEFYEKGPIEAKVILIDKTGNVVLDKGTAGRLKLGMLLAISEYGRIELKVVSVTQDQALAQPLYYWNSDRPVKVADRFTTGNYWHRPRGTGFERFAKLLELNVARCRGG